MSAALVSDRARFAVFAGFVVLVALTGGGSRADIQSLIILRPVAVLCTAYALFVAAQAQLREVKGPLFVVTSLMVIALLQLVPLPTTIWTGLSNREAVAESSMLLGMDELARPLSLDPNRTWNTFFSLFVPLAAICASAIQAPQYRRRIVPLLMAVGLLGAGLALLQAIGGNTLHLYDITHRGYPVGLFANKNHQAVMLLWLMLAGSWFAATAAPRFVSAGATIGGALATILVLFPLLVLTGSRAGLLLSPFALLLCGWLLFRSPATKTVLRRAGKRAKVILGLAAACLAAPLLFVFAVLGASGRQTALSRLFELEAADDLRWQHMPAFLRMMRDFMPFGSGFGSFENVFNLYEPVNLLSTRYMNQAHNDLLQVAIEAGLPGLAVVLVALAWLLHACWQLWRSRRPGGRAHAVFFGGSVALWLAASLVDYPLRTPLGAMLVATLTVQLCFLSSDRRSGPGLSSDADAARVSHKAE